MSMILFLVANLLFGVVFLVDTSKFTDKLIDALLQFLTTTASYYETLGILILDSNSQLEELLRNEWLYPTVMIDASLNTSLIAKIPENMLSLVVCFISDFEELVRIVDYISENDFVKFDAGIMFIITEEIRYDLVPKYLEFIWKRNLLNYVLICRRFDEVKTIGYNPFSRRVLQLKDAESVKGHFDDLLRNFHGYKFSVGMSIDNIKVKIIDGDVVSSDLTYGRKIFEATNATMHVVPYENMWEMISHLKEQKINFTFTKFGIFSGLVFLENPSYPIETDAVVILMPTSEKVPQYKYIFLVFSKMLWFSLLGSLLGVMAFTAFIAWIYKEVISEELFNIYQIFLGLSMRNLHAAAISKKLVLMVWMFVSLLVGTAFNSELGSSLISLKYPPEIESLKQIANSKFKILSFTMIEKSLRNSYKVISKKVKLTDEYYIADILKYKKTGDAYILQKSYADYFISEKDFEQRAIYKILKEYIAVVPNVYGFSHNCPYKRRFESLLLRFPELGLTSTIWEGKKDESGDDLEVFQVPLTLSHLQSAFYFILIGNICGAFVLVLERLHFRRQVEKYKVARSIYRSTILVGAIGLRH